MPSSASSLVAADSVLDHARIPRTALTYADFTGSWSPMPVFVLTALAMLRVAVTVGTVARKHMLCVGETVAVHTSISSAVPAYACVGHSKAGFFASQKHSGFCNAGDCCGDDGGEMTVVVMAAIIVVTVLSRATAEVLVILVGGDGVGNSSGGNDHTGGDGGDTILL
eukprot:6179593-Pleurochrysis_carterae.AAC.3